MAHDSIVIVAGMIGGDQHAIVAGELGGRERDRTHVREIVMAHLVERREIGIVVFHEGAALGEEFEKLQRRRLAEVVDVFFVGDAEEQNF